MAVETLLPIEEYLHTSYSPDKEYKDGVLVERNAGDLEHANLQSALAIYIGRYLKEWRVRVFTELRIRIRERWFPIPDVCLYPSPGPQERVPSTPPLLWIEILSPDDVMLDVWEKAAKLVESGVPYVWIVDPTTLQSELHTATGLSPVADKTLCIPGTPIAIPLPEVILSNQ